MISVEHSGRKPRVKVQSCVGYWVWFGARGVVLCKSRDIEIVQDAGGVFNMGRKENGGVGVKKRERRGRREDGIYVLQFLRCDSYPAFRRLMNTKRPSLHLGQPPSIS